MNLPDPGKMIGQVWTALLVAAPVKIWAQIGAAVVLTLLLAVGTWFLWRGPWLSERPGQQLDAVFYLLVGVEFLVLVALAAITGLSVNVHGGKDGLTASIDQDEAQPLPPMVRTVTETTVVPGGPVPAAEGDGELPPSERVQR